MDFKKFDIQYPRKSLIDKQVKYNIEYFFRNKLSYLSKYILAVFASLETIVALSCEAFFERY